MPICGQEQAWAQGRLHEVVRKLPCILLRSFRPRRCSRNGSARCRWRQRTPAAAASVRPSPRCRAWGASMYAYGMYRCMLLVAAIMPGLNSKQCWQVPSQAPSNVREEVGLLAAWAAWAKARRTACSSGPKLDLSRPKCCHSMHAECSWQGPHRTAGAHAPVRDDGGRHACAAPGRAVSCTTVVEERLVSNAMLNIGLQQGASTGVVSEMHSERAVRKRRSMRYVTAPKRRGFQLTSRLTVRRLTKSA